MAVKKPAIVKSATKSAAEKLKTSSRPEKSVKIEFSGKYISGLGRRKQATAQVRLFANGQGRVLINGRELIEYFPLKIQQQSVLSPFEITGTQSQYDISARVSGGGVRGQADSVRLGIARALILVNPDYKPSLRQAGLITRDARKKERKKYGKKSARRSPQWAKR